MKLLTRVLFWGSAVWAVCGLALAVAPRLVLVSLFDQAPYPDYGYVRVAGVLSMALAMLMVLVAQRIEELWWFSWTFVIAGAGGATVTTLTAVFDRPAGSGLLLWILFAGLNLLFTAGLLWGLALAGQEKPIV
jgi:hypothetical protein